MINFATCERNRAKEFLVKLYPSAEVTDEICAEVLDLVEKDIIRIQDPMMHGPRAQVIPGSNWKEDTEERKRIAAVCKKMHDALTAKA